MGIGWVMRKDNSTDEKVEVIYSEDGRDLQGLITDAFNIYLKTHSLTMVERKGDHA